MNLNKKTIADLLIQISFLKETIASRDEEIKEKINQNSSIEYDRQNIITEL